MELIIETSVKTAVVLAWVVGGLRLFGKRQIGQLNIYDLAMVMALANSVQNAMTEGSGKLTVGLTCAGTLILCGRILAGLFRRHPTLESFIVGAPTVILNNGKFITDHMRREKVSQEQAMTALREHGLDNPAEAKLVVLEVDGSFSVIPREKSGDSRADDRPPAEPA